MAVAGIAAPTRSVEKRDLNAAAILYLVGLGGFFCLSYGLANWVTSQRGYVPSIVFQWEHSIPFLPWTIVPYWSIDLFYCLSFFVCKTRVELDQHAKKLLAAQVFCVIGFLVLPLRFMFERPDTNGAFGGLFGALAAFDGPFNQAPSLHLSLAVILAARYSAHLDGFWRWLLRAWFVLIGVSALTTYQHHFIDIPTGIWVGALCCALFPDEPAIRWGSQVRHLKLSGLYLAVFALLTALAITSGRWIGGWAWWLLWPASACLIVSGIYFTGRPGLFRTFRWPLAPYTAMAWLNAKWWTRRGPVASEIADGVWLGRFPTRAEYAVLRIASLVDLAPELPAKKIDLEYRAVPVLDLTVPSDIQLDRAVAAIENLEAYRPTLVRCALGYSRSAAVGAAWLMATRRARSVEDAIVTIEHGRRPIVLTSTHRNTLHRWAQERRYI